MSRRGELRFGIEFHGAFRVGTGEAGPGVDATVHDEDLLPASSLKGVMRATARQLFGMVETERGPKDLPLVEEVFGPAERRDSRRQAGSWIGDRPESPWAWTGASFEPHERQDLVRRRARVERGDEGTVVTHSLAVAEEVWPEGQPSGRPDATFRVILRERRDDDVRRKHELVLAASTLGTHALGAERRRGLGWVTVRRLDEHGGPWPLTDEEVEWIVGLQAAGKAGG